MQLTETHLSNLDKLANFLETEITDEEFNMDSYRNLGDNYENELDPNRRQALVAQDFKPGCGSVGCAIGWGAYLFKQHISENIGSEWEDYKDFADVFFGDNDLGGEVGRYMFSATWAWAGAKREGEDSRMACVKRIREVIATKGIMTDQMMEKYDTYVGD